MWTVCPIDLEATHQLEGEIRLGYDEPSRENDFFLDVSLHCPTKPNMQSKNHLFISNVVQVIRESCQYNRRLSNDGDFLLENLFLFAQQRLLGDTLWHRPIHCRHKIVVIGVYLLIIIFIVYEVVRWPGCNWARPRR